ncbi:MAG: WXG100 family type VII secretion target [Micrococcales bacterium]|nr:WXG100 family type VII secretion target [Micrococcales bacterium]MCL2666975.1 WXG100 family type VII secretion target [Micrococcales bacterium]
MSSPDVQRAETGALAIGYNAVGEAKGSIDGRLATIRTELADLGSGWRGEAANTFHGLMTEFDTAASNLQGVLVTLEENLRTIEGMHTSQEESASAMVRGAAGDGFEGF